MKGVKFEWNKSSSRIILDKGFTRDFYKDVGKAELAHYNKYTPWDTFRPNNFHLATMVQVRPSVLTHKVSIVYSKNYARYQHDADDSRWKRDRLTHPLATSFWDKFAWINEGESMINEINALRIKHSKRYKP